MYWATCATRPFSVPCAGVDKAGKTTLLERLKSMYGTTPGTPPERILPTVGLNVGRMQARVWTSQRQHRAAAQYACSVTETWWPWARTEMMFGRSNERRI